jgi:hypothetical protein
MAVDLLQAGVDLAVIALWLGHESVETRSPSITLTMLISSVTDVPVSPGKQAECVCLLTNIQL